MKKILFALLFLATTTFGQNRCKNPMPNKEFNQAFDNLSRKRNDKDRLEYAKSLLRDNCFTSYQIKMLSLDFDYDDTRLNFATKAFERAVDKDNYYEVFDAFRTYSAVFKLHDRITDISVLQNLPDDEPVETMPQISFPLCTNYKGVKGCSLPITDSDFIVFTRNYKSLQNEALRQQEVLTFVNTNCVSMAQLMKLSLLLQMEDNRLFFLKQAFAKVYDLENYQYASEVFTSLPFKNDWIAFAEAKIAAIPVLVICEVKPEEFSQMQKSIQDEASSSIKLTLAKQILSAKKCFTTLQIKSMVTLMTFESAKLELAKYAYEYCIDQHNYYIIADAFSFSSSKEDLLSFLNSKK